MQTLFDDETTANQAAAIGQAILAVHSLRLSAVAANMEKMLTLLFIVFAIGLLVGEGLRDHLIWRDNRRAGGGPRKRAHHWITLSEKGKKWKRYSGLFILLKQKWSVSASEWQVLVTTALTSFSSLVQHPVPTHV
jgi:hypothetical protein